MSALVPRCSIVAAASLIGLTACIELAPLHQRPAAPIPTSWADRGAAVDERVTNTMPGAGVAWQDFVAEPRLRRIVARALDRNRDLRIALLDVEKARALYRVQASALVPNVGASGVGTRTRADGVTTTTYSATVDVGYEVDLFSRVRNLDAAALAAYFATRENRRAAEVTLIAEVVTAWLTLGADEEQAALARRTLANRQASLGLTSKIHDLGGTSGLAVAQARSVVEAARVQLASARTQVALDRNALDLLVGAPSATEDLPDAVVADATAALVDVPDALPSSVLIHRPDVQSSERSLMATSAAIGAARAAFFPRIVLTGGSGIQSGALDQLFRRNSGFWSIGPTITLPLVDGGLNRANLDGAIADRDLAIAAYEKTVQAAFREVADVLAARRTLAERIAGQSALVDSVGDSLRLSDALFRNGGSNYLSVLTAEQALFGAQQSLIALRLEEQTSRVALYKALGGAWRDDDALPATPGIVE